VALNLLAVLRERYGPRLVVNSTRYEGIGADGQVAQLTADTAAPCFTRLQPGQGWLEVQELKVMI